MKTVAVIADSHFDSSSRFGECCRIHDWIAEDMQARDVELVLHSGDLFERKSNPQERNAVATWLRKVASFAPVVMVRGNHDAPGDLEIFSKLQTRNEVTVVESYGFGIVNGVAVMSVAWPRKAELLASIGEHVSADESAQIAANALRSLLAGLGNQAAQLKGTIPRILLMHAMICGSKTSSGQPLVGCDMELPLEDLARCGADVCALGHIHKGQEWALPTGPVIYPGAPRRTAFGETEQKGYYILQFDQGRLVDHFLVETPCTPMVQVDADFSPAAGALVYLFADDQNAHGAEIRLRYTVDSDYRDAAAKDAEYLRGHWLQKAGAISVKVEEVVRPTTRARAPEITTAKTLIEKLPVLWALRNDVPAQARANALFSKTNQLETEVLHAL